MMKPNTHSKYRVHPTEEFNAKFTEAQNTRLFMVQETGPTKFVIEDENRAKFRIELGNKIKCSCGGGLEEHCIHTVF